MREIGGPGWRRLLDLSLLARRHGRAGGLLGRRGHRLLGIRRNRSLGALGLKLRQDEAGLLPHHGDELLLDRLEFAKPGAGNVAIRRRAEPVELAGKLLDVVVERFELGVVHGRRGLVGFLRVGPAVLLGQHIEAAMEALLAFVVQRPERLRGLIDLYSKGSRIAALRGTARGRKRHYHGDSGRMSQFHSPALALQEAFTFTSHATIRAGVVASLGSYMGCP